MDGRSTGQLLHHPDGQDFWFDAGATCLDFGYTGGAGALAVFETLHTPADLARWLRGSPLRVRVGAPITVAELAWAKVVRDAIRGLSWDVVAGRPPTRSSLVAVNRAARRPPLVPRLDGSWTAGWAGPVVLDQVLSTLAREAIEVVAGSRAERLRACAADDCPLVFLDTSRPGTRRWCAMERCGNRSKVRSHRARHRGDAPV